MNDTKANILIVDDQPSNLLALEAVLEGLGHRIVKASGGAECLRRLLEDDFAVILMDVKMPDMDGFDTATLIRERDRTRHTPIIFLTGIERSDGYVFRGYSVGAVDYLVKPVVPEVLRSKVAVFVELFNKTAEVRRQAELLREAEQREHQRRLVEERHRWEAERLRAEREREAALLAREQAARAEAEHANRAKDEFLSLLSHELRTPLNSILGWMRLLRSGRLEPAETGSALDTVGRNAEVLARLVDDLLDVSRIITGKLGIDTRPADLTAAVRAAVEVVRPAAEAKRIRVESVLEASLVVNGDPPRLQQVAWNLLSNAVKFTPPGGTVRVTLRRDGPRAELIVADNGQGIPRDFLPHVFERFRQADTSSTRRHDGLGLGLAIVQTVVELHGGEVAAHSDGPGHGATFTVRLPVRAPSAAANGAAPTSNGPATVSDTDSRSVAAATVFAPAVKGAEPSATAGAAGTSAAARHTNGSGSSHPPSYSALSAEASRSAGASAESAGATGATPGGAETFRSRPLTGVRVLLVDDTPDTLQMLAMAMTLAGARVDTARSAEEAMDRLGRRRPDLLVSDIGMPGEDGLSLIKRIRTLAHESGGRVPAIALTGFASGDDRRRCLAAGFQGYLSKPVEPEKLIRLAGDLLAPTPATPGAMAAAPAAETAAAGARAGVGAGAGAFGP
jgi:signal transduction histidine kinase